jgi:peptide-methionine (R)-S-oxide reductase
MRWVIIAIVFYFIGCSSISKNKKTNMEQDSNKFPVEKTDTEWKVILGDFSFNVMREKGTEKPYSSEYETLWDSGTYVCKGCNSELFSSNTKFDAGCGWPSFYQSIDKSKVKEILDTAYGMTRVEVVCASCGGHLGHVFNDGYNQPTGLRYCINGASLGFVKKQ